ncbi:MAG: choice-of-anchor D domain-containing protein, partial [candidate division Zixibacteria bacterium]|nr:choice-of-anchor D domain-containing protein [candidate division Zixibacteria bacterium]
MRTKAVLVLFIMLFGLTALATAQESLSGDMSENIAQMRLMASDPGNPDTLRINDATGLAGGKAVVEMYFYNDEELGALTMPITWSSSAITLDSVSWVDSRVAYLSTRIATIDNTNHRVNIGAVVIMESYIAPGQGLACRLHFNIPAATPDQIITIDTTTIGPAYFSFTLTDSDDFTAQMRPGTLTIGNPKPTIGFSPANFGFNATQDASNPANQYLTISNAGAGSLVWTLTNASTWLGLSPTSGTDAGSVTVSANIAGLTAATYYDTIVITDANASNNPQKVPVTLVVASPPKPTISLSPTTFSFAATQGGSDPMAKALTITNTGQATLNWTATKSSTWLGLSPTSGAGNAGVTVSAAVGSLVAGIYVDTIVVSDPNATNSPQQAIVTFTVAEPPKPTILLSPTSFTFNATEGGANPAIKTMTIVNPGQGTLVWTATKSSTWMTLTKMSATGNTVDTLSVDIAGLTAGIYVDTIVVSDPNATNSPQRAVVTLVLAAAPKPTIALAPSSFTFDALIDSVTPPSQTLTITNTGAGTLNWTASKAAAWLTLDPTSGSGDGSVTVSVDITGLTAGTYTDTIIVTDPEATNSPQRVPVVLFLTEPMKPSIFLSPTDFTFNAVAGAGVLDTQVMIISSVETGILHWTATNIDPWLSLYPTSGTGDGAVTLTVDATGLAAGTYVDTIRVSDPNATNSPRSVQVTLIVTPAPQPVISVSPDLLEFTAVEGGSETFTKTFTISNIGTGVLHWYLGPQEDWLVPSPTNGTGNGTVTVNVDITGLTPGVYVDTILVYDDAAANSPQYVAIGLTVEAAVVQRDTVAVSHVTTFSGGKTVVDITYQNFVANGGFGLPLYFVGSGMICDSVSWVGSRFEYMDTKIVEINNDEWTIVIAALPLTTDPLGPGEGLLAKLYFSIDSSAAPQVVPIDTGFIPPNNTFIFVDEHGIERPTGFAKGSITIAGQEPPCFSFPVDTINFYGTIGETIPSISQPVTNPCGGTLTWTATWDSAWLAVTPTSGAQDQMVKFEVNTEGLEVGPYLEFVKFESNGTNSPFYLKIQLFVAYLEHPSLAVSDSLFDFGDVCRGGTVEGAFDIYNAGDGTLPWEATATAPIDISAHSGVAPSHVTFYVPSDQLPMGEQELPIYVSSSADPESPHTVWVKMNVIDCGGECGFDIADVSGGVGLPVGVPIYAFNINDVAGLEFHIWYDTTVLQADSVTSDFMAGPDIGFADPMIHYVWDSLDGAFDVPYGEAIMTLWFTVVGEVGQIGPIEWMGISEVVNPMAQVLNITYCPGSVNAVPPVNTVSGRVVYYDLTKPVPDVTVEIQGPAQ